MHSMPYISVHLFGKKCSISPLGLSGWSMQAVLLCLSVTLKASCTTSNDAHRRANFDHTKTNVFCSRWRADGTLKKRTSRDASQFLRTKYFWNMQRNYYNEKAQEKEYALYLRLFGIGIWSRGMFTGGNDLQREFSFFIHEFSEKFFHVFQDKFSFCQPVSPDTQRHHIKKQQVFSESSWDCFRGRQLSTNPCSPCAKHASCLDVGVFISVSP